MNSTVWCELAKISTVGEDIPLLDALQRERFNKHAASCGICCRHPIATSSESVHLSEATVLELSGSGQREMAFQEAPDLKAHLDNCPSCVDRVELAAEFDHESTAIESSIKDRSDEILARSRLTSCKWTAGTATVAWTADHLLVADSTWLVSLKVTNGAVNCELDVRSAQSLSWGSLTITFSTDEGFAGAVVFTPTERIANLPIRFPAEHIWFSTATLKGRPPDWASLISVDDGTRDILRPVDEEPSFTVVVPVEVSTMAEAVEQVEALAELLEDRRGRAVQPLILSRAEESHALTGSLRLPNGGVAGRWSAHFRNNELRILVNPETAVEKRVWLSEAAFQEFEVLQGEKPLESVAADLCLHIGDREYELVPLEGRIFQVPNLTLADFRDMRYQDIERPGSWSLITDRKSERVRIPLSDFIPVQDTPHTNTYELALAASSKHSRPASGDEDRKIIPMFRKIFGNLLLEISADNQSGSIFIRYVDDEN